LFKNIGKGSTGKSFKVRYILSTNTIFSGSDTSLYEFTKSTMSAGQSYGTYSRTFTIPSNKAAGTYYIAQYVDYGNVVSEASESNNIKYVKVTVINPQCTSGSCCDTGTYKFKPRYTKCDNTVRSTQYRCSGTTKRQRRQAYRGCSGGSNACQTSSAHYNWTGWSNYQTCSSSQACYTSSSTYAYCRTKRADLTPTAFSKSGSTTLKRGSTYTFSYTRKNIGHISSGTFTDAYVLSTNTIFSTSDVILSTSSRSSLAAGASAGPYNRSLKIPTTAKTGTQYVAYCNDWTKKVSEYSESNNCKYVKVTIY